MLEETERVMTRRGFLGWLWRGLAVLVAGQGAYLGLRFLASRKPEGTSGEVVTAGLVTDFQPGTVTVFAAGRFFLIRSEAGGFLALHTRCTHLACVVGWEKDQSVFACPCHGSLFSPDGAVINPPAPRPLDYFPITIGDDGRIQVDTRKPFTRSAVSGSELTYPSAQAAQATVEATAE